MLTRRYFLLPAGMLALANFCSFALVEWKLIARHNALKKDSLVRNPLFLKTNDNDPAGPPSRNAKNYNAKKRGYLSKSKARRSERNQSNSTESISRSKAVNTVLKLQNPMKINRWLRLLSNEKNFKLDSWSTRDQIEFVKVLKERKAYDAIMMFLDFGKPDVKVFTTATFSMALSQKHRDKAFEILNKMDECSVEPTALTVIAILGSLDGPSDVSNVMKDMDNRGIVMNAEVFNSAMYAIRRVPRGSKPDANDWQVALNLFQKMRSKRIQPTSKTYHAILQVLGRTGKVTMAKSLLQQWKSSANSLQTDDYVWLAAISVCAQAADHEGAIRLITDMQEVGCTPTLRHSSALLKTFSRAGRDDLALMTLQMMLGENHFEESKRPTFTLPCVPPDLIALNTIMKACAKANNFESALSVFRRIQAGEFTDPTSSRVIAPDQITFHSMLGACHDSKVAKDIVREMRLSRRNRYGAVPPTNVTYALAINVCQRTEFDLDTIETFLRWAQDDGVQPTVYMYASAIWAAQRAGDCAKALEYFNEMQSLGCRPNSVAYDGVISALCDYGETDHVLSVYGRTRSAGFEVSPPTMKRIASAIQSLDVLEEREAHLGSIVQNLSLEGRMIQTGGPIFEALINLYGSQGRFEEALATFETIIGRIDVACLRAMLLACSMVSPARWTDAITILHSCDVVETASGPGKVDQVALGNAIMACAKANEFGEGLNLLQLYGVPERKRLKASSPIPIIAINSLIAACGRGNRPDLALALLNEMRSNFGLRPDERSYRSAVIACNVAQHKVQGLQSGRLDANESDFEWIDFSVEWWECALALFRRMREETLIPDKKTYSSVISACEAAGEWQRAIGVLEIMIEEAKDGDDFGSLNLYCFNSAISACEKGSAWVEALEIYERMIVIGGPISPNFITLSSMVLALEKAGQKELAQAKFEEGIRKRIVKPWRWTRNQAGECIYALDLHKFSSAMASAAIRSCMDSYLFRKRNRIFREGVTKDLVIITGKGLNTINNNGPVLQRIALNLLEKEYGLYGAVKDSNTGRVVVDVDKLKDFVYRRS